MPGERVLQKIENKGVYIDQDILRNVTDEYECERDRLDDEISDKLPKKWQGIINLNSPKQLAELLYTDLGLPVLVTTATGEPSTGKPALLRLVDFNELPRLILDRRRYEKALNGFLLPWVDFLKDDGRLHSTYDIAKTATGRLCASEPNLQQVPRDPKVRNLISCTPGRDFIEADYSQLELRVAAFVAGAESMKNSYRAGIDLHTKTASQMARVDISKVTKDMRTKAKPVNFGYLYGMWWKSYKPYAFDNYGIVVTDKEAEESRNIYFQTYPELLPWHERQKQEAHQFKSVRTPTGRIRHLPDIDSPDKDIRNGEERKAINTPVQSFGSDITLMAMIVIDQEIERKYKGKACLVGQVHDAIMAEADKDISMEVALMIKRVMENVPVLLRKYFGVHFDVPLVAEVELGSAWGIGKIIGI
jgi:DNA polymerase-1